jgi:hypothetical protein
VILGEHDGYYKLNIYDGARALLYTQSFPLGNSILMDPVTLTDSNTFRISIEYHGPPLTVLVNETEDESM